MAARARFQAAQRDSRNRRLTTGGGGAGERAEERGGHEPGIHDRPVEVLKGAHERAVVGQPPMEYLTEWRLTLAADLILDPAETPGSVVGKVGYGSAYALSAAFKRVRGIRPGSYRSAENSAPGLPSARPSG